MATVRSRKLGHLGMHADSPSSSIRVATVLRKLCEARAASIAVVSSLVCGDWPSRCSQTSVIHRHAVSAINARGDRR
jgi:hypothetical protein